MCRLALLAGACSTLAAATLQAQHLAFATPQSAVRQINQSHTITIQVYDLQTGFPAPSLTVHWRVILGPNAGVNGLVSTTGNGIANITCTGTGGVGNDTLIFTTQNGSLLIATASVEWFDVSATLSPLTDTNQIGTEHTVTATVLRSGVPAAGVTVGFAIPSGNNSPNVGSLGSAVTDSNGQASKTYTSNGLPGIDTIRANGVLDGVSFTANLVTKTWIDASCVLLPDEETIRVGMPATVTATVSRNGVPQSGITVDFLITSGPNDGVQGLDVTDVNGQAELTYIGGLTPGTDTITSSGSMSGVAFGCQATETWADASCTLSPDFVSDITGGSSSVGTPYSVTSHVQLNGSPAQNVVVLFEVISGLNAGLNNPVQTNASGDAVMTYSGVGLGFETIRASGIAGGIPFECTAVHSLIRANSDCNANHIDDICDLDCGAPGGPCDGPGCAQSFDDCDHPGMCAPVDCIANPLPPFAFNGLPNECDCQSNRDTDTLQDPASPIPDDSAAQSLLSPVATCSAGALTLTPFTLAGFGLIRRRLRRR
jgi:5-hydroxyisourate hydrolase-like protein (transthyretin family)